MRCMQPNTIVASIKMAQKCCNNTFVSISFCLKLNQLKQYGKMLQKGTS